MSRGGLINGFRWLGAFGAMALALSGCGGGNGGGILPPAVDCASTSGASGGYTMGTCSGGAVLESQLKPITAGVTIAGSSYTLDLSAAALGTHTFSTVTDQTDINKLGQVQGLYLQKDYVAGAYAAIGDFASAAGLSHTNFGLWERFVNPSEGYYGGWYVPHAAGDANPVLPGSGSATYTGVVVGALAPVAGNPPVYGLSATLSLTANFSNTSPTVSGTMSDFWLSNQYLPAPQPGNIAPVTMNGTIAAGGFSGTMGGAAASGAFEGKFFGPATGASGGPAEIGGRFQFVTPDARQVVGAFGGHQ